jgi:hypothetical protein
MPSDDMYGGLPYRDVRGTVIFDNNSKLVCGLLPELTNLSTMEGSWPSVRGVTLFSIRAVHRPFSRIRSLQLQGQNGGKWVCEYDRQKYCSTYPRIEEGDL